MNKIIKHKKFLVFVMLVLLTLTNSNAKTTSLFQIQKIPSKTIVFITGAFVSHHCWDEWRTFFESQGYTTIAPPWPEKDVDVDTLRGRHPDKNVARITLRNLESYYMHIIDSLPDRPILIGHSLGGLLVQMLLNKGYGSAGITISSVPPKGIIPHEFVFYKSNIAALGFLTNVNKTYLMTFKKWQYVFTNGMSLNEQKEAYEKFAIPESKRAVRGSLTRSAKVNFRKEHSPLLMIAGSKDHCMPASLNRRNFKRYKNKSSVTEFIVRDGRNHFVLGQPTWREDAQFIFDWIQQQSKNSTPMQRHPRTEIFLQVPMLP